MANLKEALNKETQQSERTREEVDQLKQLVLLLTERLEVLEQTNIGLQSLDGLHRNLITRLKGISRRMLVLLVMAVLFCILFAILASTFIKHGK